jgi:hypothetical protein
VSMFQQQMLSTRICFNYNFLHRKRNTTLFVWPTHAIALLCLLTSAFPIV